MLRKATIALKRAEKENLEKHLADLKEKRTALEAQAGERREQVKSLVGKLQGVDMALA